MRRMILFYAVLLSGMSCQAIWAQTICHDEIFYEINTKSGNEGYIFLGNKAVEMLLVIFGKLGDPPSQIDPFLKACKSSHCVSSVIICCFSIACPSLRK